MVCLVCCPTAMRHHASSHCLNCSIVIKHHFLLLLQTLYLSKNSLRSLQGIQQFSTVVTVAAADNLIDSFDELDFLTMASQPHMLKALSLEGNPVARSPHYRSHLNLPGSFDDLNAGNRCCLIVVI